MSSFTDFIQYDFLLYSLIGAILLSLASGPLSPLIIAKRQAFMGGAVSHSTLLGLALGLWWIETQNTLLLFLFTLVTTLVLTLILARQSFKEKLPEESFIGIFYTITMALGILVHSQNAQNKGDLMSYLFGNVLMLSPEDLIIASIPTILSLVTIKLLWKQWSFWAYDPEGAQVAGHPIKLWHYLFYLLQTLIIVSGLKLVGIVLIQAFLLIPGHFALKISKDIKSTYRNSLIFAVSTSIIGLYLANLFELPAGASMAVVQFIGLALTTIILNLKERGLS
ncbi:MAG: hypothetical protein COW00_04195 [Bdellovibrio sp. CG12_big_fil_rev_8_21_14_0_65_39_13]|nr:MAG: hypothetical protein COW78_20325 [Bdellovibrio sp. CG22_combo_CG10-13_8_21_14_all_39_27]PIQ61313.1 MAG: hypothetical protein COW00_04195 [Bdellovibrio sp. CG12_big_fil_rev_8_21_14_0_65_39_13]PIR33623.1 MAG: hypothetical protein COV37_15840 [Bdellovibrio sp. CG11_big_fil_rev_8_21_14_0_20_39_38]